jgi:hypothetical protein
MQSVKRPTGVTILGILAVLSGIVGIAFGAVLLAASLAVGTITQSLNNYLTSQGYSNLSPYVTTSTVATVLGILGAFSLLVGIFWLVEGWGAMVGKGWAWTLGIIVFVLSIISNLIQVVFGNYSSAIGVIVDLGIIYYITRPHVKAFFGKGTSPATPAKM